MKAKPLAIIVFVLAALWTVSASRGEDEAGGDAVVARGPAKALQHEEEMVVPKKDNGEQLTGEVVFFTPGFHCDAVWLEDQRDYAVSLLGDVRQNLDICRFDPHYGVYLHELSYLKPYFDTYVWDRGFIKQLIRERRVGTGGSYNQPSETLIGPEGIVRNIIYGRLFHERILGDRPGVYTPWDVFGHCAQLSQILAKSRFIGCLWSKDIRGFPAVFEHQALDGTKLPMRRQAYGMGYDTLDSLVEALDLARQEVKSYGLTAEIKLDCNDFKPPCPQLAGHCAELLNRTPPIVVTGDGQRKFFERLDNDVMTKGIRLPVTARDMGYYHQGTGLSRVEFKIANRRGENLILNAEKFGAIASFLGARYPDKALDKAWRQLLFNQHHDAITGTPCDRAYLDLMAGYREAIELSADALHRSLRYISRFVNTAAPAPTPRSLPLFIFNPLNWERSDVVEAQVALPAGWKGFKLVDETGDDVVSEKVVGSSNRLRFIAQQVPSLGYRTYYLVEDRDSPPTPQTTAGSGIENDFLRIVVDPNKGGGITSLYDKEARRELIPAGEAPANELVALAENPSRNGPSWEIYTTGPKVFSRDFPAEVQTQIGPVTQRLVICGPFKDCTSHQEIILYSNLRRVDFITSLEGYKGERAADDLFVVTFPNNLQGVQPVFEERFGAVVRHQSKGYLDFQTQASRNFSGHGLATAYQWMDRSYSALIQFKDGDKVPEATVALGCVGLMIRNRPDVVELAQRLQTSLIRKGIFCTPFLDDNDRLRRRGLTGEGQTIPENPDDDLAFGTSFRIVLDVGGKNRYLPRIFKRLAASHRASLDDRLKRDGYAFMFCRDEGVPAGWPPLPVLLVTAADVSSLKLAIDKLTEELDATGVITLSPEANASGISPQVDNYGLAILNQGNVLNSVENDGTMVLCLMHTANWSAQRFPFQFIPEWKTHRFAYALYPHSGDWRTAQTYRRGFEFNNPLIPLVSEAHAGPLPSTHSFLQVEPQQVVVTAFKPHGNPSAGFEGADPTPANTFTLRLYEATGSPVNASIKFPARITECLRANLLEEPTGRAEFKGESCTIPLGPFSIETLVPSLTPPPLRGGFEPLGVEVEKIQPIHFRYWQHNAGEAPLGNSPISISLHGEVKTGIHIGQGGVTVNTIQLAIANDYVDKRVSGVAQILVPEDWEAVPRSVEYNLGPGEYLLKPILLGFRLDRYHKYNPNGVIKARLEHEGQVYQDVIEVGDAGRLEMTVKRTPRGAEAVITNPTRVEAEAVLTFITPLETWGEADAGAFNLSDCRPSTLLGVVSPSNHNWVQAVHLAPGESGKFRLTFEGKPPAPSDWWVMARLAHNGQVDYKYAPGMNAVPEEGGSAG